MANVDPQTGSSSRPLVFAALIAVALSTVLIWSGTANAGYGAAAAPTFPSAAVVGETGLAASIQLRNNNSNPDTAAVNTVCNFGDPLPCPVGDPGITLIPSCGHLSTFSACNPDGADPGVFKVSSTGVGALGSAYAGTGLRLITLIDPVFGQLRFTPQAGEHVYLFGLGSMCQVDFTFDVLKMATVDLDPTTPGQQTVQVVDNTQYVGQTPNTASGRGTSSGTTLNRATPTIATNASGRITVGGGQLLDTATVWGRVNAQPGATIDFRLYGPDDATCSGTPAFESLGIPYPITDDAVTSAAFTPTATGDYRWVASYSGDVNNAPVTGTCNSANEIVTVSPVPAPPTFASALARVLRFRRPVRGPARCSGWQSD